jgi:hypothetical protein
MPELSHIDPRSAALLVMDYQVDTLTEFMTAEQSAKILIRRSSAMAAAGNSPICNLVSDELGSTMTAITAAFGTSSCSNSRRLGSSAAVKK